MFGIALAFIFLFQDLRPGTVSGVLRTMDNSPAVSFRVAAIPAPGPTVKPSDGAQYFYTEPPVSTALTDSQGRYRLVNVPPGRYFIVSGTTYFPTTTDADRATVVTVAPNSNSQNLDFKLMAQFGGKVSGHVTPKPAPNAREKAILTGVTFDGYLEVPISQDGLFEFGHIPRGDYLIDIVPTIPGLGSYRFQVADGDMGGLNLVRPATHVVSGRIVMQNGPIPRAQLAFSTTKSYVGATINPDATFTARLHSDRHHVDLAGMPGGYSVVSVRSGSQDISQNLLVGNADISGVVITVAAPARLPHVRGKISGFPEARLASTKVELTGPIVGSMESTIRPDGSFEFPAAPPGTYSLRIPQVPELKPVPVVVTWNDADVQVAAAGR